MLGNSRAKLVSLSALIAAVALVGCSLKQTNIGAAPGSTRTLMAMGLVSKANASLDSQILRQFAAGKGIRASYIPGFDTIDRTLKTYERSFGQRSPSPDLIEIDVVWPSLLANDLVDLAPFTRAEASQFAPEILSNFRVGRKLLALPTFLDVGVLYYRRDLLAKYGFHHPPKTWDELGQMSKAIQDGERRSGVKDFWGYVWQGAAHESLTCNALEWQASEGGGTIISADGVIAVNNPNTLRAVKRAASWVGTISPPGVIAFSEDDSANFWTAGKVAFMRNWSSFYGEIARRKNSTSYDLGIAPLPGGLAGSRSTLGGFALAVSKYSPNRQLSIEALKTLTSENAQVRRVGLTGSIPTRIAVLNRPDLMSLTALKGNISREVVSGIVARPSLLTGSLYPAVSGAYCKSVHDVLARKATAEVAMSELEDQLVDITGFRRPRPSRHRF